MKKRKEVKINMEQALDTIMSMYICAEIIRFLNEERVKYVSKKLKNKKWDKKNKKWVKK